MEMVIIGLGLVILGIPIGAAIMAYICTQVVKQKSRSRYPFKLQGYDYWIIRRGDDAKFRQVRRDFSPTDLGP